MKELKLLIVLVPMALFFLNAQSDTTNGENWKEWSYHWLDAQKDFEQLPGISLAVVKDQEVIWKTALGYSNPDEEQAADTSTIYSICSISKLFTAVAVMQLFEEGKLRLDDEVADILPWFELEQNFEYSGPITVRSLLTHSSGIPRESNQPYWTGPDFPFPEREPIIEGLKEQSTLYPASHFFQYSNLALTLLGEIVAEVSGQDFHSYINENILSPLNMFQTHTSMLQDKYGEQLAIGYSSIHRDGNRAKVKPFEARGIDAAAGFASTVTDLAKFASWQFRLLETKETEILSYAALHDMHRVHWLDPDWNTSWGLGFHVSRGSDGKTRVGHGGSCPGYRSQLFLYPADKMAYVVMINSSGTNPAKYINGIKALKGEYKRISGLEKPEKEISDIEEYTGLYSGQPWFSEVYIGHANGHLISFVLPTDQPTSGLAVYKPIAKDQFQRVRPDRDMGEVITFLRNEAGEITHYEIHNNFYSRMVE